MTPRIARRVDNAQDPATETPVDAPESPQAASWPAAVIERRPLALLVPYARNARLHSDGQIAQIMASMREWGWTQPVLISETDTIIAGHGRVMAGMRLGLEEAPVIVARGWSEAKTRAYIIADNRLAENASWDREMLGAELSELRDAFDLSLTGFTTGEIDAMTIENLPDLGVEYDESAGEHVKFIKCPECGHEFPR